MQKLELANGCSLGKLERAQSALAAAKDSGSGAFSSLSLADQATVRLAVDAGTITSQSTTIAEIRSFVSGKVSEIKTVSLQDEAAHGTDIPMTGALA